MVKKKELGLVLSGGGVRGLAHAGILQALDEMNCKVDMISGTSSGAIVGVLYAAGVPPADMIGILKKSRLFDISGISFKLNGILRNEVFRKILKNHIYTKTFEELAIPVIVTATDFTNGKAAIFETGDFINPVIASCSIPLVFTPTHIDGKAMVDGGLVDNFPAEIIRDRCKKLIGVNVNPIGVFRKKNIPGTLERIFQMAISSGINRKSGICELFIEPQELNTYSVFDTKKAEAIFKIGYEEAIKHRKKILELTEQI